MAIECAVVSVSIPLRQHRPRDADPAISVIDAHLDTAERAPVKDAAAASFGHPVGRGQGDACVPATTRELWIDGPAADEREGALAQRLLTHSAGEQSCHLRRNQGDRDGTPGGRCVTYGRGECVVGEGFGASDTSHGDGADSGVVGSNHHVQAADGCGWQRENPDRLAVHACVNLCGGGGERVRAEHDAPGVAGRPGGADHDRRVVGYRSFGTDGIADGANEGRGK